MGRIFTSEQVLTDCLPNPEDFDTVAALLRQCLGALPDIPAALLCGSYMRGDHTIRSDFDVLVVYTYRERAKVLQALGSVVAQASEVCVPVQCISLDTRLALSSWHTISPMFLEHFGHMLPQGMIKGNPLQFIGPRGDMRDEVVQYLARKMKRFEDGEIMLPSLAEAERVRLIGKALSFPVYVARMMLQCQRGFGSDVLAQGDDKSKVIALYPALDIPGSVEVFFELIGLDRMYDEELPLLRERFSPVRYEQLLRRLEAAIPLSYRFARLNLEALVGGL